MTDERLAQSVNREPWLEQARVSGIHNMAEQIRAWLPDHDREVAERATRELLTEVDRLRAALAEADATQGRLRAENTRQKRQLEKSHSAIHFAMRELRRRSAPGFSGWRDAICACEHAVHDKPLPPGFNLMAKQEPE